MRHLFVPACLCLMSWSGQTGSDSGLSLDEFYRTVNDKKVVAGKLHFVLADGIGRTSIASDVEQAELRAALVHIGLKR